MKWRTNIRKLPISAFAVSTKVKYDIIGSEYGFSALHLSGFLKITDEILKKKTEIKKNRTLSRFSVV